MDNIVSINENIVKNINIFFFYIIILIIFISLEYFQLDALFFVIFNIKFRKF